MIHDREIVLLKYNAFYKKKIIDFSFKNLLFYWIKLILTKNIKFSVQFFYCYEHVWQINNLINDLTNWIIKQIYRYNQIMFLIFY